MWDYMQIVKKDSFRSQGSAVNKTDDMYRVVVDMRRTEYSRFAKLVEGQKPTTNSFMVPCIPSMQKWRVDIIDTVGQKVNT